MTLYDEASAAGVTPSMETRRELINFAVGVATSEDSPALAHAHRVLAEYTAGNGFVNVPDGSAWILRVAKPALGAAGRRVADVVWDSLRVHGRTPLATAMTAYLEVLDEAGADKERAAAVRASLATWRGNPMGRDAARADARSERAEPDEDEEAAEAARRAAHNSASL